FRDDTAIGLMHGNLAMQRMCQQARLRAHQCDTGFVTGAFNAENDHKLPVPRPARCLVAPDDKTQVVVAVMPIPCGKKMLQIKDDMDYLPIWRSRRASLTVKNTLQLQLYTCICLLGVLFMLESLFKLREHGTNIRTEILAGLTTFLTMSYIIFVNPDILGTTGMDKVADFVATCLASALG